MPEIACAIVVKNWRHQCTDRTGAALFQLGRLPFQTISEYISGFLKRETPRLWILCKKVVTPAGEYGCPGLKNYAQRGVQGLDQEVLRFRSTHIPQKSNRSSPCLPPNYGPPGM